MCKQAPTPAGKDGLAKHFFILNPCCQVESVFETLVEDGPEEESTLTSKMSVHMSVREYVLVRFGEAGGPWPWVGGRVATVVSSL